MQKQSKKVIDSVSASDLLKALNTLKTMGNPQCQFQISFSKENIVKLEDFPDFPKNNRTINYEHYMAGKEPKKTMKSIAYTPKKSPLGQQNDNHESKVSDFKSRSHSPLDTRSERTESRVSQLSRQGMKKKYEAKEAKIKQDLKKKEVICPSFQSKRILDQKQKSGSVYVPIQHRAEELLREKQQKIARLQKQKAITKILQEKECTFKPQIKPYYKKQKTQRDDPVHKISEIERQRFEQCFIDQQFLCTPTQPLNRRAETQSQQSFYGNFRMINDESESKLVPRKYKNQKFNCLLDLIQ